MFWYMQISLIIICSFNAHLKRITESRVFVSLDRSYLALYFLKMLAYVAPFSFGPLSHEKEKRVTSSLTIGPNIRKNS